MKVPRTRTNKTEPDAASLSADTVSVRSTFTLFRRNSRTSSRKDAKQQGGGGALAIYAPTKEDRDDHHETQAEVEDRLAALNLDKNHERDDDLCSRASLSSRSSLFRTRWNQKINKTSTSTNVPAALAIRDHHNGTIAYKSRKTPTRQKADTVTVTSDGKDVSSTQKGQQAQNANRLSPTKQRPTLNSNKSSKTSFDNVSNLDDYTRKVEIFKFGESFELVLRQPQAPKTAVSKAARSSKHHVLSMASQSRPSPPGPDKSETEINAMVEMSTKTTEIKPTFPKELSRAAATSSSTHALLTVNSEQELEENLSREDAEDSMNGVYSKSYSSSAEHNEDNRWLSFPERFVDDAIATSAELLGYTDFVEKVDSRSVGDYTPPEAYGDFLEETLSESAENVSMFVADKEKRLWSTMKQQILYLHAKILDYFEKEPEQSSTQSMKDVFLESVENMVFFGQDHKQPTADASDEAKTKAKIMAQRVKEAKAKYGQIPSFITIDEEDQGGDNDNDEDDYEQLAKFARDAYFDFLEFVLSDIEASVSAFLVRKENEVAASVQQHVERTQAALRRQLSIQFMDYKAKGQALAPINAKDEDEKKPKAVVQQVQPVDELGTLVSKAIQEAKGQALAPINANEDEEKKPKTLVQQEQPADELGTLVPKAIQEAKRQALAPINANEDEEKKPKTLVQQEQPADKLGTLVPKAIQEAKRQALTRTSTKEEDEKKPKAVIQQEQPADELGTLVPKAIQEAKRQALTPINAKEEDEKEPKAVIQQEQPADVLGILVPKDIREGKRQELVQTNAMEEEKPKIVRQKKQPADKQGVLVHKAIQDAKAVPISVDTPLGNIPVVQEERTEAYAVSKEKLVLLQDKLALLRKNIARLQEKQAETKGHIQVGAEQPQLAASKANNKTLLLLEENLVMLRKKISRMQEEKDKRTDHVVVEKQREKTERTRTED